MGCACFPRTQGGVMFLFVCERRLVPRDRKGCTSVILLHESNLSAPESGSRRVESPGEPETRRQTVHRVRTERNCFQCRKHRAPKKDLVPWETIEKEMGVIEEEGLLVLRWDSAPQPEWEL